MKIKIDKKEFEKLYKIKTQHWLANHYDVSIVTIANWAKKLSLTKGKSSIRYEFV